VLAGSSGVFHLGAFAIDPLRDSIFHVNLIFSCAVVRMFMFALDFVAVFFLNGSGLRHRSPPGILIFSVIRCGVHRTLSDF
jgi:hypothetical protein